MLQREQSARTIGAGPTVGAELERHGFVGVVPFPQVLSLHRSNPELFQTGGVSVVVPGLGVVPATWCDGI